MVHRDVGDGRLVHTSFIRKRGSTTHFRRRIPADLRKRLASSEIILSLGEATAGEAKRISARLWLQSEALFMMLRSNPALDAAAIAKVAAATMSGFSEHAADILADVGPTPTESVLDEPVNVAARMGGLAMAAQSALDRCDVDAATAAGTRLGKDLLGESVVFDAREGRRLARAVFEGVKGGADAAELVFARSARSRQTPAITTEEFAPRVADGAITALQQLKVGDSVGTLLDEVERSDALTVAPDVSVSTPSSVAGVPGGGCELRDLAGTVSHPALCAPQLSPTPWPLDKADWPLSRLWTDFSEFQVENEDWGDDEAKSSLGTLRMVVHILGNKPLSHYTADEMRYFRKTYRRLPSKYAQAQPWRDLYETQGPYAVIEAVEGLKLPRISVKTWNKLFSRVSPLFNYGRTLQGAALAPSAPNPMDGLFIKRKKKKRTPAQVRAQWRLYSDDELVTLFTAPKFLGCTSASRWDRAGELVFRDARYWLTLIGFLHGNRREEPVILLVKHVRKCPVTGIWYFNWLDPDLEHLLKADGSPRDVPLHWILLAIGFLEARVFGRDPEDRLFPDAESDAEIGGDAGPFGAWFGRLRESCGFTDHDVDFHAARHTVIMQLDRKNYKDSFIEGITGHESLERQSSIDSYKHPHMLETLKPIVDAIDMPIDVDLLNAAVARSDALDRRAAWPDLQAPRKWRRTQ